jgi:hypothetical protein
VRIFYEECNPAILQEVQPLVASWAELLLPKWVTELYIYCKDEDNPACAVATVNHQYRRMCITFYRPFMTERDHNEIIVHELCHAYTTPIKAVGLEFAYDAFTEPTPGTKTFERRIEDIHEALTCDLAAMVLAIRERG